MESAETLVRNLGTLPPIPDTVLRAQQMLGEDDVQLVDVSRVIGNDPALAGRVVKIASSPIFGAQTSPGSVAQAVLRLGCVETRRVVMTAGAMAIVPELPAPLDLITFWRLSLGTALAGRKLALDLLLPDPEQVYLAGLFHCIGEALLAVHRPRDFVRALERAQVDDEVDLHTALLEVFGHAPNEVSAVLLRDWGVGADVIDAVEYQRNPDGASGDVLLPSIVFAANRMCCGLGLALESPDGDGFLGWEDEISATLAGRIEDMGFVDMTYYLLSQMEFLTGIEDLVRATFDA